LRALDEASRLTVILFYFRAYSIKEIGEFLDEPTTTIKSRLRNARAKLRKELEEILENSLSRKPLPENFAERVTRLIAAGADVNWDLTVHHSSPLGWAVLFEPVQTEVAEYLIGHGANHSIFTAIALGKSDVVRQLVEEDPIALRQRMSRCELFRSPIEFATKRRQFEIARLLVELGSEVSLSEAAGLGMVELVASRLGESTNLGNLNLAVQASVMAGQIETTRQLLEHGADPNFSPQGTSLIFEAIGTNDKPMAQLLIESGAGLEFKDRQWNSTALGWQVFFGRVDATKLAIELGSVIAPNRIELAQAGERGELRRWSTGTSPEFRRVFEILKAAKVCQT